MMKKFVLMIWVVIIAVSAIAGESDRAKLMSDLRASLVAKYGSVAESPVKTGFLYDLGTPISKIEEF